MSSCDIAPAWLVANYGDDDARTILATLAASAALGEDRWDKPVVRSLLANLRTDVDLRIDRDVFVRSREANIEIYSDGDLGVHVNRARRGD